MKVLVKLNLKEVILNLIAKTRVDLVTKADIIKTKETLLKRASRVFTIGQDKDRSSRVPKSNSELTNSIQEHLNAQQETELPDLQRISNNSAKIAAAELLEAKAKLSSSRLSEPDSNIEIFIPTEAKRSNI